MGGACMPSPFHSITSKIVCTLQLKGQIHTPPPISPLPLHSVLLCMEITVYSTYKMYTYIYREMIYMYVCMYRNILGRTTIVRKFLLSVCIYKVTYLLLKPLNVKTTLPMSFASLARQFFLLMLLI